MKRYLMLFGHSNCGLGIHIYFFHAENEEEAKEKAIARLKASPMSQTSYEVMAISDKDIVPYQLWQR